MKFPHFLRIAAFMLGAFLAGVSALAAAQATYEIVTPMTFGQFGILKNDAPYDLTISYDGNVTHDDAFVLSVPAPQAGEMLLEGLPATTQIDITFNNGTMALSGGPSTPGFTVVDFTTNQPLPNPFESSAGGTLTVLFGATLRTTGGGQAYASGSYVGSFEVTIDF